MTRSRFVGRELRISFASVRMLRSSCRLHRPVSRARKLERERRPYPAQRMQENKEQCMELLSRRKKHRKLCIKSCYDLSDYSYVLRMILNPLKSSIDS